MSRLALGRFKHAPVFGSLGPTAENLYSPDWNPTAKKPTHLRLRVYTNCGQNIYA